MHIILLALMLQNIIRLICLVAFQSEENKHLLELAVRGAKGQRVILTLADLTLSSRWRVTI